MSKLLFILRQREALYTDENYSHGGLSSGLLNSATFITEMLTDSGIESKLVQVVDNNCIDREVTLYRPTHVIIEAYWVVPSKFAILTKLHPDVKWIIRNHSELPFLATEGIAIDWALEYLKYPNVYISSNSDRALSEMKIMAKACYGHDMAEKVLYLPNYYTFTMDVQKKIKTDDSVIDIGSFGAIRPMKNQLLQAIAAIEFARKIGKRLRFHINYSRIEGNGNNCFKNIRALFEHTSDQYELIEHTWMAHDQFIEVCSQMDIAMCVSFTETFCIVAADMVSMDIPTVVSHDIRWFSGASSANPVSSKDMVLKLQIAWCLRNTHILQTINKWGLKRNIKNAQWAWERLFLC